MQSSTLFSFLVLSVVQQVHSTYFTIGVLWERSMVGDMARLTRSLEVLANLSTQTDTQVSLSPFEVTNVSPAQIRNFICDEVANGTLAFMVATGCVTWWSLRSSLQDFAVPVLVADRGCGNSSPTSSPPTYITFSPPPTGVGRIVADLVQHLNWGSIALFYDESTAFKFDAIVEALAATNSTVQAFKVPAVERIEHVRQALDYVRGQRTAPCRLLIVCSLPCQVTLLKQAVTYDDYRGGQGYFKFEDMWLLVSEVYDMPTLERTIGSIDNVAAIVPVTIDAKYTESLLKEAFSYLVAALEAQRIRSPRTYNIRDVTESPYCRSMNYLTPHISQRLQTLVWQSRWMNRTAYEVYSAYYTRKGRSFRQVAKWSRSALVRNADIFPNLRYGLNGRHFTVSTNVWEPFVKLSKNTSVRFEGLCMELLKELSTNLNFSYTLGSPPDGQWGGKEMGRWTGLVGQLERRDVDLVVAPLSTLPARKEVMDFSESFYNEYVAVLAKLPDPDESKWSLYLSPFQWQVWLCIVLIAPLMGLVVATFTRLSPAYQQDRPRCGLALVDNAIIYTVGSVFSQGGIHLPTAQSGRFVVGFWWMYCMIVVATYSGNLIAFLTVSKPALPFNTLAEMVAQTSVQYGLMHGTAAAYDFSQSHNHVFRETWQNIQRFSKEDPDVLSDNHEIHINKVLAGGYAYINDKTGFELALSKHCAIQLIREEFMATRYSVGLQNNSAYRAIFSRGVTKVKEGGLITKWKKHWWPRQSFCSRGMVTEAKAVTLKDVQGAYYAMAALLLLAACVLIIEGVIRCDPKSKVDMAASNGFVSGLANGNVGPDNDINQTQTTSWTIYSQPESHDIRDIYTTGPMVDIYGQAY